jgi:fructose-bisphosphate aldolase class II
VEQPQKFDPRDYLGPAREAVKAWMLEEMKAFGTAGHAGDYKPVTTKDMLKVYFPKAAKPAKKAAPKKVAKKAKKPAKKAAKSAKRKK